jgi:hypothetical protein
VWLLLKMRAVSAYTVDDAYISFLYARNFAHGLGLVYNPGERVPVLALRTDSSSERPFTEC